MRELKRDAVFLEHAKANKMEERDTNRCEGSLQVTQKTFSNRWNITMEPCSHLCGVLQAASLVSRILHASGIVASIAHGTKVQPVSSSEAHGKI